jgi:hypothetical protein
MVLITAALAVWTGANVSPDYLVTGHIAMVGPTTAQDPEEQDLIVNPWSTEALAEAAAIRLGGQALAEELHAGGYEGEWSIGVTGRQPWLQLEVVAASPDQAKVTVERLREIIEVEVRDRQNDYNIPAEDRITTVWFAEGETVETVTGKMRRALVAVVGAGLLFSIGVVIAFDAIQRRRIRSAAAVPAVPVAAAEPVVPRSRYVFPVDLAMEPATQPPPPRAVATAQVGAKVNGAARKAPAAGEEATAPLALAAEGPATANVAPPTSAPPTSAPPAAAPPAAAPPAPAPAATKGAGPVVTGAQEHDLPDDATIVLPLSNHPWAGRPPRRRDEKRDPRQST